MGSKPSALVAQMLSLVLSFLCGAACAHASAGHSTSIPAADSGPPEKSIPEGMSVEEFCKSNPVGTRFVRDCDSCECVGDGKIGCEFIACAE
jgi:hypothetical protein